MPPPPAAVGGLTPDTPGEPSGPTMPPPPLGAIPPGAVPPGAVPPGGFPPGGFPPGGFPPYYPVPPQGRPPTSSNVGLWVGLGVVAVVVMLAFLSIVAITFLGREAEPKFSRVSMSPVTMPPVTMVPDSNDLSDGPPGTAASGAPALDSPMQSIRAACADHTVGEQSIRALPGFGTYNDGRGPEYAQIVRTDARGAYPTIDATVNLSTGEVEQSPFEGRLIEIGNRSTVVVCVTENQSKETYSLLCANGSADVPAAQKDYIVMGARAYLGEAYSLGDGRSLSVGNDEIPPPVLACPSGYTKVPTPDPFAELDRLGVFGPHRKQTLVGESDERIAQWVYEVYGLGPGN